MDSGLEESERHGGFTISGSAPDAFVGDEVDFQYTVDGAYPGQGTITGTVDPEGPEVDSSGRLTGTYPEEGTYTVTLNGVDDCGHSASHIDTIVVSAVGVACGVSQEYTGGETFPTEYVVTLGSGTGTVTLDYLTGPVPDRVVVVFDGVEVIDTGYVGDPAFVRGGQTVQEELDEYMAANSLPQEDITLYDTDHDGTLDLDTNPGTMHDSFVKSTATTTAILRIYAPLPGTGWSARLGCPVEE